MVEVDGAADFLGIGSRRGHIENHRSMGVRRNPHLYQALPARAELEFQKDRSSTSRYSVAFINLAFPFKLNVAEKSDRVPPFADYDFLDINL